MERVGEHTVPAGPLAVRWLGYRLPEFRAGAEAVAAVSDALRRSRAGDAWDRSQADSCGAPAHGGARAGASARSGGTSGVSLGMPSLPVRAG